MDISENKLLASEISTGIDLVSMEVNHQTTLGLLDPNFTDLSIGSEAIGMVDMDIVIQNSTPIVFADSSVRGVSLDDCRTNDLDPCMPLYKCKSLTDGEREGAKAVRKKLAIALLL